MSSQAASSGPLPNVGSATAGSTAQQANTMTRNFILGIPKEGLPANSPEAADLQAAEAFVSDIQQEILAYDIANAKAMEAYATRWWSKVPYFGRHAKRALEYEAATAVKATDKANSADHPTNADTTASGAVAAKADTVSGSSGLHLTPEAAAAAMQVGGTYLHKQTSQTSRGLKVERTSAIDAARLSEMANKPGGKTNGDATLPPPPKMNSWLFRRQHPGWVPLMQRWWVPWLCMGSIVLIWTPDVWKLRCLYTCDHQYALLRQAIHKAYWRATMSKEDYDALIADIEAERPTKVSATSCPFE